MDTSLPSNVRIMEVGPRDGLQNEKKFVDTATKIWFIDRLIQAGLKQIEITAFVSPKWIPPLADHVEVARGAPKKDGVNLVALVPNMQGYESAIKAGMSAVSFVLAASDTHNQKNINATTLDAFERYREVIDRAQNDGVSCRAYISCAFGCPYEGNVPVSRVVDLAAQFFELGVHEIAVSDTIGVGDPIQTKNLVRAVAGEVPIDALALHLHDTRGTALANVYAALCFGVAAFDASVGGLGGCPYAPGASGNLATEDLVYMLHRMGATTGIDLDALCLLSSEMENVVARALPSKNLAVYRCGQQ